MAFSPEQLASRLTREGEKTVEFFSDLSEDTLTQELYADGQRWQVVQVLRHLVQAERAIHRLMISIVGGQAGTPEDFDLDAYNERKVSEIDDAALDALVPAFREARAATIAWVSERSPAELALQGRHPFLGLAPIEDMVKLLYRHTQLHQRDIRRLLDGEG